MQAPGRLDREVARRRQEAEGDRDEAEGERREGRGAGERRAAHPARALGRPGIAAPAPGPALDRDQAEAGGEHHQRQAGGAGQVGAVDPGVVDRDREGAHPQEFRRPDVVEGFEQRQAGAERDGRAGERQGDPQEHGGRPGPEAAPGLDQRRRLHQEQRPGRQVDVGIEHEAEEQDAAGQGAQVRQDQVARAGIAEERPDRALHRTDRVQEVEIGIGRDVGGHGQRQQQRPVEQAPPRELVGRDEPGRPGADHHDDDPDPGEQQGGVVQSRGQDVGEEVRPQPARALQRLEPERRDRRQDQEGGEAGGERPGREQEPGTPRPAGRDGPRGARPGRRDGGSAPHRNGGPPGRGRTIEIPVDQAVAIRQERPLPTRGRSTGIGATSRGIRVPSGRGRRRSRP